MTNIVEVLYVLRCFDVRHRERRILYWNLLVSDGKKRVEMNYRIFDALVHQI